MGIDVARSDSAVPSNVVRNNDFAEVMTNGHYMVLVFTAEGRVSGHELLLAAVDEMIPIQLTLVPVAKWASNARTAVALNRTGEILVFHDKKLAFARRRGRWGYFAPETIVTPLASKAPVKITISEVRKAVYRTYPDVSSVRSGGCIGVAQEDVNPMDAGIVSEGGVLPFSPRGKIACLRRFLGDKPSFHNLDRTLRQEIEALDGAKVLTLEGEILAAGAMLRIKKGSPSGGRHMAATPLNGGGIDIKVSNDGYVQVFADENEDPFVSFG